MITPTSDIQKQIDDINKEIEYASRRLQKLRQKEALGGANAAPEVTIEIEDLENDKLPSLQSRLQQLKQEAMEVPIKKSKLSDRLRADQTLNRQFNSFKEKWSEKAMPIKFLPGLARDWYEYADIIDQFANDLVPQDWGSEDIFILCCAIYLHKLGLVPNNRSSKYIHNVFDQYPQLSKDYILEIGHTFGLEPDQREDIAWICYGHRNLIKDDKSIENTLANLELRTQTKKGRRARVEIAYCLRILSLLGAFNASMSDINVQLYYMDPGSDYEEYRMNSVVSGFEIRSSSENGDRLILLKPRLSEVNLIEDIRYLKKARENLENALKDYPNQSIDNFLTNSGVEIDYSVLAQELENKVPTMHFRRMLGEATRKSIAALLDARYGEGSSQLRGWGPMYFSPRGANPTSRKLPKEVQDARVANTAEVLLALTGWLDCADHKDELVRKVIETVNDVLPSFKTVQVNNLQQSDKESDLISRNSTGVKETGPQPHRYNPLASLTFVVPTTRANGLFVLAAANLLKQMKKYPALAFCKQDVQEIMKESIDWLCNTETGPFHESIINYLPDEYLFQSILAFKALIKSKEYWTDLHIGFSYEVVDSKIADFVHSLLKRHGKEKGWPATAFKAMTLEILLYYVGQSDESIFNKKTIIVQLAKNFVQELLDEVRLDNSPPWKDDNQTLTDEDRRNSRPWTHVTSVWAIEGLTSCVSANLLTPHQKSRFLQTIPLILATQNQEGFYDSIPHPDDPESITIHYIFKTGLYTYALTQINCILPES